uniref:Olfactory receptor n=1 Tax=Falco tinnunculus TaxID=100819 RepID=A0A8C4UHZ4_FALTI
MERLGVPCKLMAWENWTTVTEFIFKGFTDHPDLQVTLFVVFLLFYVITVVGNLGIIAVVWLDSQLQTPMYFFLSNLSFLDLCYSSVVTPKMLLSLSSERNTISFAGCFVQLYFYVALVTVECYLLAAMAYDRYLAICSPLCYPAAMSQELCTALLAGSYAVGFVSSLVLTVAGLRVSFCSPKVIDHFFCDGPPLFKLACSDTYLNQVLTLAFAGFHGVTTISVILISYGRILSTILRMGSVLGKRKAFGTCSSHMVVVAIFYGSLLFMYLRPSSSYSLRRDKIVSVFYTVVTPMLNPFIYSLRNQEVKRAVKRACISQQEKHLLVEEPPKADL